MLYISLSHKSRENSQYFFVKTKTKTKTLFSVLEAPRDQDFSLEDYISTHVYPTCVIMPNLDALGQTVPVSVGGPKDFGNPAP